MALVSISRQVSHSLWILYCTSTPSSQPHCIEIWIYVIPEKELRGLSPNFNIHVSVIDLYIPPFGPPIFLQQYRYSIWADRSEEYINRSQKHKCRNWDRSRPSSFPGNICFEFSVLCLCSAPLKHARYLVRIAQCRTPIPLQTISLQFKYTVQNNTVYQPPQGLFWIII